MPRINRRRTRRIRQAVSATGYDGAREIASRTVEDPYDPGNLIAVPANLRHDPLLRMFQRHEIDAAQLRAGERLRAAHETLASHGLRAIDLGAERVDSGRSDEGIPEAVMRAGRRLREAQSLLGWQGYRIVAAIVCGGLHGSAIARHSSVRVDRNVVQHQLRNGLEQLAVLWGFATDPKRLRQRASMVGLLRERADWIHGETELLIRYAPAQKRSDSKT